MTKRGKVLRGTSSGPGLVMIEGEQYPFSVEKAWKSHTPPRPRLVVDVELDDRGGVQAIIVVPDAQLAQEQPDEALSDPHRILLGWGLSRMVAAALLAAA